MRTLKTLVAIVSGALLYTFSVVQVGGVLAAIGVPKEYFHFFGRGNGSLAIFLLYLFTWAAPVALLVAGGLMSMRRLAPSVYANQIMGVLFGMAAAFAYWNIFIVVPLLPGDLSAAVLRAIEVSLIGPVWSLPNQLAPWLGFGFAAWVIQRKPHQAAPSGA